MAQKNCKSCGGKVKKSTSYTKQLNTAVMKGIKTSKTNNITVNGVKWEQA